MKRINVAFFIFISLICKVQAQDGFTSDLFHYRQPSTRSEAMGKAYASIDGDLSTLYYNPAGISSIKGIEFQSSFATPRYMSDKAKYIFFSLGYNFNKYLTIGLTQNHFTWGEELVYTDSDGYPINSAVPFSSNSSLSLASQPIKNLFLGCNINIMHLKVIDKTYLAPYFDFGVIKKLLIFQNSSSTHSCNFGASIVNSTSASINTADDYKQKIPTLSRIGWNYELNINKNILIKNFETFAFLYQFDYQNQLYNDYHSAIRTGAEFTFLEMLALRMGYYNEKIDDHGFPDSNKSKFSAFTYGLGIQVPLYKLSELPLNCRINYTNLPQKSYSLIYPDFENFTSFSIQINWLLNTEK